MPLTLTESDECKPLKNLCELSSWKADESDWSVLVNNLSPRSVHCYAGKDLKCHKVAQKSVKLLGSDTPKTLLCHDMKGGYLDDKYVLGAAYSYQYLFYHWSVIDIFVYFSHHFVTIPPLMWINAAHNHGVQILGTIITEGVDGEEIWNEIFSSESLQSSVVDQLVAIQQHYHFDGYLVNVENRIDRSQLPKLMRFLEDLKRKMKDGIVIWYDAVSFISGKLDWQNELNEHNKSAFEVCDGVFLNYAWNLPNLQKSLLNAGVRLRDVFVGVDVFGRGCYGGGGFNTDVAMSVIRTFGLSAAIFGFGWTHETQASDFNFFYVEQKFWTKLFPYLYIYCPSSIPFKTNFNQGVSINPQKSVLWYDLSLQSFQLSLPSCSNMDEKRSCFHLSLDDSFSGGSSLLLNRVENETEIHKLMMCDFLCSEETPLKLSVSGKSVAEIRPFQILLSVENRGQRFTIILNVSKEKPYVPTKCDYSCSVVLSEQINLAKTVEISPQLWITNTFPLKFEGIIDEINVKIEVSTLIGRLSIEQSDN